MAAPALFAAATILGAGFSAIAKRKAANAEARLMRDKASFLDLKASQLLQRTAQNERLIREDSRRLQGSAAITSFASGAEIDLASMANIASQAEKEIRLQNEEAAWQAMVLREEAESFRRGARSTISAGGISSASTILAGYGSIAREYS